MERDSSIPKYRILVDEIKKNISEGKYQPGDKLESENELVRIFGYSRQTVRQALGVLENECLVDRRRGSGTYISEHQSGGKTYNIGVITTYITDYIFPFIIEGVESVLSPRGYHMILGVTKNKIDEESRVLGTLMEKKIDGFIVEGTKSAFPNPNLEIYRKLKDMGIPVVFFNSYYPGLSDSVKVVTDDKSAGYDITNYLISRGAKRPGGIFKSDDIQGHLRYAGYSQALIESGIGLNDDDVIWYTTADERRFEEPDMSKYLGKSFENCDSVICFNDKAAVCLENIFLASGRRIPEDVMIGSIDNSKLSEYAPVKITSMDHPKAEEGVIAARKLLNIIEYGVREESVNMRMKLVVKDSTK